MANRNKSYDEVLASKFKNLEYAQGYLLFFVKSEGLLLMKLCAKQSKQWGYKTLLIKLKSPFKVSQALLQKGIIGVLISSQS